MKEKKNPLGYRDPTRNNTFFKIILFRVLLSRLFEFVTFYISKTVFPAREQQVMITKS